MQQLENYIMQINGNSYSLTGHTTETAMQYATRLYHPLAKKIAYSLLKENKHGGSEWKLTVSVNRGKAKPRVCREEVTVFLQKQNNSAN